MPPIAQATIQGFFTIAAAAVTNAEKGRAFEDLACYLFTLIPGIKIHARNILNQFDTEEIDVAFFNDRDPAGLEAFGPVVLVECKNWSKPVGSEEVNWFLSKIEHRGLDFGILLATHGITGNAADQNRAHHIVAQFLLKKIRLIVINRAEIEILATSEQLLDLIKLKFCQLHVSGTVLP